MLIIVDGQLTVPRCRAGLTAAKPDRGPNSEDTRDRGDAAKYYGANDTGVPRRLLLSASASICSSGRRHGRLGRWIGPRYEFQSLGSRSGALHNAFEACRCRKADARSSRTNHKGKNENIRLNWKCRNIAQKAPKESRVCAVLQPYHFDVRYRQEAFKGKMILYFKVEMMDSRERLHE